MKIKVVFFLMQLKKRSGLHEQAAIRVLFAILIWIYASTYGIPEFPMNVITASVGYAFVWLAFVVLFEQNSRAWSWLTIVLDIGITTAVLVTTEEVGAVFFWVMLWVIIGNGIRFGKRYLIGAHLLSLAGLSIAFYLNQFWHQHNQIATGIMLTMIFIPLYVLKLVNQLNRAVESATVSDKAKSYLLASMNHELRTPLNAIVGVSALLDKTPLLVDQKSLVTMLNNSATIMHNIIDNLLRLGKEEFAAFQTSNAPFHLPTAIKNTVEMFRIQAREKGLRISIEYENEVFANLVGDSIHLQQILINLVGNACKFTKSGGSVKIAIRAVNSSEITERLRFEIRDTGIGIKPGETSGLFRMYSQANPEIAKQLGGSGLGTMIARDLVNIMDGEMGVTSTENKGSTFWFEIPFTRQNDSDEVIGRPRAEPQLQVIAIGLTEDEKDEIGGILSDWNMDLSCVDSLPLLFKDVSLAHGDKVAVIYNPESVGLDPRSFAKYTAGLVEGKTLFMVLISQDGKCTAKEAVDMGYTAVMHSTIDKTILFNALQKQEIATDQTVTLLRDQSGQKRASINILIADDNKVNRSITSKIVERVGHQVVLAEDGDVALDKLEKEDIGLMILDMKMPVVDGIDVLRIYHAMSIGTKHIPVIILTANATLDARHECMEAGADAFLTKPVYPDLLVETIAKLTGTKPPQFPINPTPRDANEEVVINESTLNNLKILGDGQNNFKEEVVLGFIAEVGEVLSRMDAALNKQEVEKFRTMAFSIQGGSSNVGADSLFRISNDITKMSFDHILAEGPDKLQALKECYRKTQAMMFKYLNKTFVPEV